MSLDADGNGGASARVLVLERDLVVRALPPFLDLGDLLRLSQTNAGCLREVRQGLRALGHGFEQEQTARIGRGHNDYLIGASGRLQ